MDDPAATKTDNRTAYQNAEAFISAFELTFQVNDVDVNREWKKYLTISFLYGKNTKHMRWYQNHFEPLDAITSWNEIKQAIADRSGNHVGAKIIEGLCFKCPAPRIQLLDTRFLVVCLLQKSEWEKPRLF